MPKALWNGAVIAESDRCQMLEGNCYFPPEAVRREFLRESETRTECHWKGSCSYYDLVVNGKVNRDAAWTYRDPKPAAANIKDWIAFWKGVTVAT